MSRKKASAPGYRYHISGQAVVTFCGKNFYLGEHDSPTSWAKYYALLAEYHANGMTSPPSAETHQADQPITVRCVTAEFRQHIETKYGNNAQEYDRFRNLCTTLEDEYGDIPACEFGPRKLSDLRDLFVASGNCRKYANRQTRNVITIFRHALSREILDASRIVALTSLESLRYGQTTATESKPVEAVDLKSVRLTAPHLSPTLKAMVRIQAATGMRSGELTIMRPCDIERRPDGTWWYVPEKHKTTYQGRTKKVPIIGDAKLALKPFLDRSDEAYCFSPKESVQWYRDQRTSQRKTPPKQGNNIGTNRKLNPKKGPRNRFDTDSYRKSVQVAQKKAKVDKWCPHQLRHTAAGVVRDALGIESAQALLGHSHRQMTEHYAKQSEKLAIEAAGVAPNL